MSLLSKNLGHCPNQSNGGRGLRRRPLPHHRRGAGADGGCDDQEQPRQSGCRRDHGESGPYLFGGFSVADAMFAPVVLRVRSYGLPLSELARRYQETMLADAHLADWIEASCRETRVIPHEEVGAGA